MIYINPSLILELKCFGNVTFEIITIMKYLNILFLSATIIAFYGCPSEPVEGAGDLELQFEAKFGDQQFFINEEYTFPSGRKVRFSQFDFFVSNLSTRLNGDNAGTTDLTEVDFVDFTGSITNPIDPSESRVNSINLPIGDYENISLMLGLSEELNTKTPNDSDLGESNPLRKASHYWTDWNGYIFMKIEGNADFNDDGMIAADETFIYHTGKTENAQNVSLAADFNIVDNQKTQQILSIDLSQVFFDSAGSERFDMNGIRSVHADGSIIPEIMEGAASAMKMQ